MQIESVYFKEGELGNGLKEIKIMRIPKIVLLTGPNGGGKTRLLAALTEKIKDYPSPSQRKTLQEELQRGAEEIVYWQAESKKSLDSMRKKGYETHIANLRNTAEKNKKSLALWDTIKINNNTGERPVIVHFVPQSTKLQDPLSFTENDRQKHCALLNEKPGNETWEKTIPSFVQETLNKRTIAEAERRDENHAAIKDFNDLNTLVHAFLGAPIKRNENGNATIFGLPIGQARLSQGQALLFQLAVAIFAQGGKLNNFILLLDEPESHLHPSVSIQVLSTIIDKVPDGQIWLATHSLSLLSAFFDENIWYMDKGEISWVGRKIEKVLHGLVGESNNDKLRAFIGLPHEFAIKKFAFECLQPPGSVITESTDPQVQQAINSVRSKIVAGKMLKMLDYGAGKGRLVRALGEKHDVKSRIDYIAFDAYPHDGEICKANIRGVYDSYDKRYFNNLRILLEEHGGRNFDLVVCCNVFHEISPDKWHDTACDIQSLLKPEGHLLLLEDNCMPHGERAHEFGFVVLDTLSLRKLFQVGEKADAIKSESMNDRLYIHLIPVGILSSITTESKKEALSEVKKRAKQEIEKIKGAPESGKSFSLGTQYAFWSQQFTNAILALERI